MESQDFFEELVNIREGWLNATRVNEFAFDTILSGLYHDPSHFIYEILQNAEDAAATSITFTLLSDKLEIIHNGNPFSIEDVKAITGIGNTTKSKDLRAIGKFGVGFKSVFAITQSPAIHSGDYHFEINNFVVPSTLEGYPGSIETKFVFPFNHKDRSKKDLFELISEKLQNLENQTLLFLNNVTEIQWQTPSSKGHYLKVETPLECGLETKRVEIITQANGEDSFQEFLVFIRPFRLDGKSLSVEIAYQISADDTDSQSHLIPIEDSRLIVYFPTEKTTFLKFLIHGPYKTTPNRENIPLDDPQNQRITGEIATLVSESLPQVRNLGFLDVNFFQILPIDPEHNSPLHPIYSAIFESVKSCLSQKDDLLPTAKGQYTFASNVLLARAKDLAELFADSDIEMLFQCSNWLDTGITADRTPILRRYCLDHLGIKEIGFSDLAAELTAKFFETKDDEWMSRFYSRLNDTPALWRESNRLGEGVLRHKPIIRLQDDNHTDPFDEDNRIKVYLPTDTDSDFPVVKRNLIQDPEAKKFLESLGLTTPDLFAEIRKFVFPKYLADKPNVDEKVYLSDIRKIVKALSSGRESQQKQLITDLQTDKMKIIKARNLSTGSYCFTSSIKAYKSQDYLEEFFLDSDNVWIASLESGKSSDLKTIGEFLSKLEIPSLPRRFQIKSTLSESEKQSLRGNSGFTRPISDRDFDLDGLDNFFSRSITLERSLILWKIIKKHIEHLGTYGAREFFSGTYSWFFYTDNARRYPAKLLKTIQAEAWLYDQFEELRRPGEIMISQLDEQYDIAYSNIEVLKEEIAFKSDLIDQLSEDERELIQLFDGVPMEKLKESEELKELIKQLKKPDLVDVAASNDDKSINELAKNVQQQTSTKEKRPKQGSSLQKKRGGKRLLSYVYPDDVDGEGEESPPQNSRRDEISNLGVEKVIEFEKSQGRDATDMNTAQKNHPGYDLESVDENNQQDIRYIEVKSLTNLWDSENPARMTKTEFETAKLYGKKYWLYIVEQVESTPKIFGIRNPANSADYYLYDHGWQSIAMIEEIINYSEDIPDSN